MFTDAACNGVFFHFFFFFSSSSFSTSFSCSYEVVFFWIAFSICILIRWTQKYRSILETLWGHSLSMPLLYFWICLYGSSCQVCHASGGGESSLHAFASIRFCNRKFVQTIIYVKLCVLICYFLFFFSAVLLMGEPVKWENSLQIIIDILLSNGTPNQKFPSQFNSHLPIVAVNTDYLWMSEAINPRYCFSPRLSFG